MWGRHRFWFGGSSECCDRGSGDTNGLTAIVRGGKRCSTFSGPEPAADSASAIWRACWNGSGRGRVERGLVSSDLVGRVLCRNGSTSERGSSSGVGLTKLLRWGLAVANGTEANGSDANELSKVMGPSSLTSRSSVSAVVPRATRRGRATVLLSWSLG